MTIYPVAILGAGPIGLVAAAHAVARGLDFICLEQGPAAGSAVKEWEHVRVFSPWRYNIDGVAKDLLLESGWRSPDPEALPTGSELVRDYLEPLAAHPSLAPYLRLSAKVTAITRLGRSKLTSEGRDASPFVVHWQDATGQSQRTLARAVIDATGTWGQPNPIGLDGLPVPGEAEANGRIAYRIPDVKGDARATYAGQHTLVIGAGHSAINAVLDLLDLQEGDPATKVSWATRGGGIARLLGGGLNDALPGRGRLGLLAEAAIRSGRLTRLSPFAVSGIKSDPYGLALRARQGDEDVTLFVHHVIVATGFRPDLALLRELRVALDPIVEAPWALAPLIDPNLHSCGTVPPHGVNELTHPEPGFYIVGMKSYGRAPTFLMATGYEQVRSVVAELAGDTVAARQVHLELPETGVCSGEPVKADCCGGAAPQHVPAGRAAFSATRPSGNKSTSIFSPGLMPRCCNRSFRKVTCPLAVTVNVVMARLS